MKLPGGVPATAGRADFRLARRDEGAMAQRKVAVGELLGGCGKTTLLALAMKTFAAKNHLRIK